MPEILNAFRTMYPRIEPGMLLAAVARRLRAEGRWMGRAGLPRDLAAAMRGLERGARGYAEKP